MKEQAYSTLYFIPQVLGHSFLADVCVLESSPIYLFVS